MRRPSDSVYPPNTLIVMRLLEVLEAVLGELLEGVVVLEAPLFRAGGVFPSTHLLPGPHFKRNKTQDPPPPFQAKKVV